MFVFYSGIRFLLDQNYYSKGYNAYTTLNCEETVFYSDKIINSWRLSDFGGLSQMASILNRKCKDFIEAKEKETTGDLADACMSSKPLGQNMLLVKRVFPTFLEDYT
jgi:hypothetical protein